MIVAQIVLYQPQNFVSVDVGATAVISCVPSDSIEDGELISWYKKSYKPAEGPVCVKTCFKDNDVHKYGCKKTDTKAILEIYNVQNSDSGVYYCTFHYVFVIHFGNGTSLIVKGKILLSGQCVNLLLKNPDFLDFQGPKIVFMVFKLKSI